MINGSYQRSAPDSRKWSSVIADPTAFAKKIDYVKKTAISEDLSGRRIVMQDDGVGVAVYDLPPETHVGIVIGSSDSLYQNILDELVNSLHRYSTANLFGTLAGYLGNVVRTEKDVLEHRLVVIEEQRPHLVKTLRCGEVPPGFCEQAGIQQKDGLPS